MSTTARQRTKRKTRALYVDACDIPFDYHRQVLGDTCNDWGRPKPFKDNRVLAQLGDDPQWRKQVLDGFKMRDQPERWQPGKFIHPHDACFDHEGNIYVAEWVTIGRISRLSHVG